MPRFERKTFFSAMLAALCPFAGVHAAAGEYPWTGTWGVAPQPYAASESATGKTLRQVVHTSTAGDALRITVSNLYGNEPLTVSNVHAARPAGGSSVDAGTDQVVTFGGLSSVTVAAGATATSDDVAFAVPATGDVAISFFVVQAPSAVTGHSFSQQDRFVADGNVSGDPAIAARAVGDYQFLTNVDVQSATARGAVVTIGASITDGYGSSYGANHRWPNRLAERLQAAGIDVGVVNEGISGNNLFSNASGESGLTRFGRDALSQANVRWVIFSDDPINDLGSGSPQATVPGITGALSTLIDKAHAQGVRFACSTLTPFEGYATWNADREAVRSGVNEWIKGPTSPCDAVVDQDLATHDPSHPTAYLPAFDAGDHLHPNDAGYQAIANAVDLALFGTPVLAPVTAPTGCGAFVPGNGLKPGDMVHSCDGRFTLILQNDGNLVLYKEPGIPLWATGTVGLDSAQLELSRTGDLILRGTRGETLWHSGNAVQSDAKAFVQVDGNFVVYGTNGPVWSSGTANK